MLLAHHTPLTLSLSLLALCSLALSSSASSISSSDLEALGAASIFDFEDYLQARQAGAQALEARVGSRLDGNELSRGGRRFRRWSDGELESRVGGTKGS